MITNDAPPTDATRNQSTDMLHEAARVLGHRPAQVDDERSALWSRAVVAERARLERIAVACRERARVLGLAEPSTDSYGAGAVSTCGRSTGDDWTDIVGAASSGEDAVEIAIARGRTLARDRRRAEAIDAYASALAHKSDSLRSLIALGDLALEEGRGDDAERLFREAIAVGPEQSLAHRGLGNALRFNGRFAEAWIEDEWHHPPNGRVWRDFEQPLWTPSSQDGKTVLLWNAGALGDSIDALRFLPLVKAYGGRLVVEAPAPLVSVVRRMPCVDQVVTVGGPLPMFDVHERFTRLPTVFQTDVASVPDTVPYVVPDERLVQRWRRRLRPDGRLMVGLTWGGNATHHEAGVRFASLQNFAPLAHTPGVRFVGLQLSPQSAELFAPPEGLRVEHVLDDRCTVADTAALIQQLDLVISVDTMVAHLTGALAKPVWILVQHVAAWRWLQTGERSCWYPTMRIFRQRREDDWDELLARVADALRELAHRRDCAVTPSPNTA